MKLDRSTKAGGRAAATIIVALLVGVTASASATAATPSKVVTPPKEATTGWPAQFGTTGIDRAGAVATAPSGDVYVAGSTGGAFAPATNQGSSDIFIARYDKNGFRQWVTQIGTANADSVNGIAVVGNAVYIAGATSGSFPGFSNLGGASDAFVARLSTAGTVTWIAQFGTTGFDVAGDVGAAGGGVYVAGTTSGAFAGQSAAGNDDAFIARFSGSGTPVWTKQFGTNANDSVFGLVAVGGAVYLAGETEGAFSGSTSQGDSDSFVARFNTSGGQVWTTQFGNSALDQPGDIAIVGNAVYVAGITNGSFPLFTLQGSFDAYVARLSTAGSVVWLSQFGTSSSDAARSIAATTAGVYAVGETFGAFTGYSNQGQQDGFLARFTPAGIPSWVRQYGTAGYETIRDVALRKPTSPGGAIVIVGDTDGTLWGQFDAGNGDAFIATFPG